METYRGDRSLGFSLGRLVRFAERVDAEHKLGLSGWCNRAHANLKRPRSWLPQLLDRMVHCIRRSKSRDLEARFEAVLWGLDAQAIAEAPEVLSIQDCNDFAFGYYTRQGNA